jgi:hypothetical protein
MQLTTTRALLVCLAAAGALAAQEWRPGVYMRQAMDKIVVMGTAVEQKSHFGWDPNLCLMAAFLRPKATVEFDTTLEAGSSYAFLGGGDDTVEDLDLEISRSGEVVGRDTETDATPVVIVKPTETGTYTIRLNLYKATTGSFVAAAVLKQGGFTVPVKNLERALERNLALAGRAAQLGNGARFHDYNNQWAMYGWVIRQGEERGITRITFPKGRFHVLAAGDVHSRDLDLVVKQGGTVLDSDTDDDATPVTTFNAGGSDYSFTVKDVASDGPSLVIASVIESDVGK